MTEERSDFEQHQHDELVHDHEHWHVTHNYKAGGFEHLSWKHSHAHDHPAVEHAHVPHEDFESEHVGEAHDHDHGEPVRARTPIDVAAKAEAAGSEPAERRAAKRSTKVSQEVGAEGGLSSPSPGLPKTAKEPMEKATENQPGTKKAATRKKATRKQATRKKAAKKSTKTTKTSSEKGASKKGASKKSSDDD